MSTRFYLSNFSLFSNIKEQLNNAPVDIKHSFNTLVQYFAAPKSPDDITLDNICELPIGFLKKRFWDIFEREGVLIYTGKGNSSRLNKKKFTEVLKSEYGNTALRGLRSAYSEYLKAKQAGAKSLDKIKYDIFDKDTKVPIYEVTTKWEPIAGRYGEVSLKVKKFKRNVDSWFVYSLPSGYELSGYDLVDVDVNKITTNATFVVYESGKDLRLIRGSEIPTLRVRDDRQSHRFLLYKY